MAQNPPGATDLESTSLTELVQDCRDVLGALHIDLTGNVAHTDAPPVLIPAGAAAALDGYAEYGA